MKKGVYVKADGSFRKMFLSWDKGEFLLSSPSAVLANIFLKLLKSHKVKLPMSFIDAFEKLLSFFVVNCLLPVFIFFLVLTLAIKERDSNLRIKETLSNLFKKLF